MKFDPLCRLSAAAGLAALVAGTADAAAPVVTMPLGDSTVSGGYSEGYSSGGYSGAAYDPNCPPGYGAHGACGAYGAGCYGWPQYGYTPPAKYPVERIPVQYLRYYPAAWYGLPGSTLPVVAPQVYMPTDTTQQGFYYQRVPTWQPVPGMLPPAPDPAVYHQYVPAAAYGPGAAYSAAATGGLQTVSTEAMVPGASSISDRTVIDTPSVRPVPPLPSASEADELPLTPPSTTPPTPPKTFVPPAAPAAVEPPAV